jgi:hypothetical protein
MRTGLCRMRNESPAAAFTTRRETIFAAHGFSWNGKTYPSLSKVAFAITGSRWSGPRFFGLRDKTASEERP